LSGDDVKTKNPYEQDADIDRRTEANRSQEIHTWIELFFETRRLEREGPLIEYLNAACGEPPTK
jgi:hypothetical protein